MDFHEYLAGPSSRKKLKCDWIIPCHSVFQLLEHFVQNWSLGFAKNAVPKLAIVFKEVLGVVDAR